MSLAAKRIACDGVKYEIRWYEPDDEDDLIRLFSLIRESRDREWFRRTYVDLPYLDHVPIVVAATEDEIVGARPYVACEVRWGDAVFRALVPQHLVVHPDHRGRGVYRAMNDLGNPRYEEGEPELRVTDPVNEKTVTACREMGHTILDPPTRYFRLQDPATLAETFVLEGESRLLRTLARPAVRGYLGLRDRTAPSDDSFSVAKYDGVESARLEALYESAIPLVPHPVHDRTFFEWRYGVPRWQPSVTYVAERDGRPVAGAVVQTTRSPAGVVTTYVRHVVPLTGGETWLNGVRALLGRIVSDHPDSDVLRTTEPPFPPSLLSAHGFHSDERFPISRFQGTKPKLAVKAIGDLGPRTVDEETFADAAGTFWSLKF